MCGIAHPLLQFLVVADEALPVRSLAIELSSNIREDLLCAVRVSSRSRPRSERIRSPLFTSCAHVLLDGAHDQQSVSGACFPAILHLALR